MYKLAIELDVNTDIYPMQKGMSYSLVLANWLNNGDQEFDLFENQQSPQGYNADMGNNLIDKFDYVMHGKIFEDKLDDQEENL